MAFFNQLADALSLCSEPEVRHVRTTVDPPMEPAEALNLLKESRKRKTTKTHEDPRSNEIKTNKLLSTLTNLEALKDFEGLRTFRFQILTVQ